MKKLISIILCMLMITSALPSFAAANGLEIESVVIDYRNEQIIVSCSTDVGYRQRVTAFIYSGDTDPGGWSSYAHIGEAVTDLNGKCVFNFTLDRAFTQSTYTASVVGSGVSSNLLVDGGKKTFTIIPLNTEDTLMSGAQDGLNYNDAGLTNSELADLFNSHASAMGLDGETLSVSDANDVKILNTMLSIRNEDFDGSFGNLTDVSETYEKASALVDLGNTTTGSGMETVLTEDYDGSTRAELLGIDLTSDSDKAKDYRDAKTEVNSLLSMMNQTSPSTSVSDFQDRFGEALALATVNRVDVDTMDSKLNLYSSDIEIDPTKLQAYNRLNATDKYTIARMLTNKNFRQVTALNDAFENALRIVLANPGAVLGGNTTGNGGGGGGGGISAGGSAGSGGGNNISGNSRPVGTYTDSHEFEWASEAIKMLSEIGVISGYPDGSFGGNLPISRSEFIKMIVVAFGFYDSSAICEFTDAQADAWYFAFISSAVKAGLITGYPDGSFGVNDAMSREDAAVILYRTLLLLKAELSKENSISEFSDKDLMSDYSYEAIRELQLCSVINGFVDGTFGPKVVITRAQTAKMIFELLRRL